MTSPQIKKYVFIAVPVIHCYSYQPLFQHCYSSWPCSPVACWVGSASEVYSPFLAGLSSHVVQWAETWSVQPGYCEAVVGLIWRIVYALPPCSLLLHEYFSLTKLFGERKYLKRIFDHMERVVKTWKFPRQEFAAE